MSDRRVPFLDLRPVDANDLEATQNAIRRVLERGWLVLGPEVEAFELEFAEASGVKHVVGVGNGTDALFLLLKVLGIGRGDEVITTPLSAAFTALSIVMTGARPVFVDVDPERLTIDPAAVSAAIGPTTAAILPVHLYGQPADMPSLVAIAERHHLALVEDCCQAHLATCGGQPVGTFGAGGAFSFYPTKNLGAAGDAGAVCSGDADLAERVRRLRHGGQADRFEHQLAGVNSRLDELQAAILRLRLSSLRDSTNRRRTLAARYRSALEAASVAVPPERDPGHVYHLFPVRSTERNRLRAHLYAAGIETLIHYPTSLSKQKAFADHCPAACPTTDTVCAEVLSLPLHPRLTEADVTTVAKAVQSFPSRLSA